MHQQALGRLFEAARLEWFFSRGQTVFERSPCGGTLARAELYSISRQYRVPDRLVYDDDGEVIGSECGITARPTAELLPAPDAEPDIKAMRDYALISARIKRLDRVNAQVLELLYGDHGQRWIASAPSWGRLGALFHMTPKGRAMVAAARKVKGALQVAETMTMLSIVFVQASQPTAARAQELAFCQAQALAMEGRAHAAWQAMSAGKRAA